MKLEESKQVPVVSDDKLFHTFQFKDTDWLSFERSASSRHKYKSFQRDWDLRRGNQWKILQMQIIMTNNNTNTNIKVPKGGGDCRRVNKWKIASCRIFCLQRKFLFLVGETEKCLIFLKRKKVDFFKRKLFRYTLVRFLWLEWFQWLEHCHAKKATSTGKVKFLSTGCRCEGTVFEAFLHKAHIQGVPEKSWFQNF